MDKIRIYYKIAALIIMTGCFCINLCSCDPHLTFPIEGTVIATTSDNKKVVVTYKGIANRIGKNKIVGKTDREYIDAAYDADSQIKHDIAEFTYEDVFKNDAQTITSKLSTRLTYSCGIRETTIEIKRITQSKKK